MDAALHRALKKLSHRNWSELKDEWVNYIPHLEFEVEYPEPTLWQIANFPHVLGQFADRSFLTSRVFEKPSFEKP